MSPKIKQKKPNEEEESEDSYSSDSSDDNEAYTGNEVINIIEYIYIP